MKRKPITNDEIAAVLRGTIKTLTDSEAVGGIVKSKTLLRELQCLEAAIQRLALGPDWISVADALPDDDATVLIALDEKSSDPVWIGFHDSDFIGGWRFVDASSVAPAKVTHWAHFPAPPKVTVL